MILDELTFLNFRNFKKVNINFEKNINLIIGLNGSGKTNIIEAIFVLANIKSFKKCSTKDLIKWNEKSFFCKGVFDGIVFENAFQINGLKKEKKLKVDGNEKISLFDYYEKVLTVLFSPEDIYLIEGSPDYRRTFFNQIISKIDIDYLKNLSLYKKLLKYRNVILKSEKSNKDKIKELSVWDINFSKSGFYIYKKRKEILDIFSLIFKEKYETFSKDESVYIFYKPDNDYDNVEAFYKNVVKNYEKDIFLKHTSYGVQKDDFIINGFFDKNFSEYASQGQKRSASVSLKIAEKEFLEKSKNEKAILLIDDIFSEFDEKRKNNFIENVCYNNQTIFTMADFNNTKFFNDSKIFKIEKGNVLNEI